MRVCIVSTFRNSLSYVSRYFQQIDELETVLTKMGSSLQLVLGYGDSTDGTPIALFKETVSRFDAALIDVSHGGPEFGPVVDPQRFKQLAFVWNKLWEEIPKGAEVVGMIESDLIWSVPTALALIEDVEYDSNAIFAPMIYDQTGRFYDTWAYRKNAHHFQKEPPYHLDLDNGGEYYDMDSIGSCIFMSGELARKLHWPEEDVIVGLCREAKLLGADILLDKAIEIYHP